MVNNHYWNAPSAQVKSVGNLHIFLSFSNWYGKSICINMSTFFVNVNFSSYYMQFSYYQFRKIMFLRKIILFEMSHMITNHVAIIGVISVDQHKPFTAKLEHRSCCIHSCLEGNFVITPAYNISTHLAWQWQRQLVLYFNMNPQNNLQHLGKCWTFMFLWTHTYYSITIWGDSLDIIIYNLYHVTWYVHEKNHGLNMKQG
jgi:hypothetical protein